jgi:hypothetical protein
MQELLPRERVWSDPNMGIIFLMKGLSRAAFIPGILPYTLRASEAVLNCSRQFSLGDFLLL